MKINRDILEDNYRKLWVMERINMPFIVAVGMIRDKWRLPLTDGFKKIHTNHSVFIRLLKYDDQFFFNSKEFSEYARLINQIGASEISENIKSKIVELLASKIPSVKFRNDINNLIKEFEFDEVWILPLTLYVISDTIYTPHEKRGKDIPSKSLLKMIKIYILSIKKKTQHDYLRNKVGIKSLAGLSETRIKKYFPPRLRPLIYNDLNIAQMFFNEPPNISDEELSDWDRKNISKVKTYRKRIRESKWYVNLTKDRYQKLLTIFSD